jgi:hypothetical protein
MINTRTAAGTGELVNFKRLLLVQYILFCAGGLESCSLVHWTVYMAVFACFWAFSSICTYLFLYETVNIYELHDDSMRQFAMSQVNK